jgi:hypothetical protein
MEDPGLQPIDAALGSGQAARERRRGQPEADCIGAGNRLVQLVEPIERRDRPEHLLARQERVVGDVSKTGSA